MSSQQGYDADPLTGEIMPREVQVPTDGAVSIATFGSVITAQKIAVMRDDNRILTKLKVLCGIAGSKYVYSWPVKDNKNKRVTLIEGPTVKLANDLFRTYGNCGYDVRVVDDGTHIIFYGRFTDYETGASYTRPFRQRKSQKTGMKDQARAEDIIFQIGASKCFRNCIVNALSTQVDYMLDESKKKIVEYVQKNPDKALEYIEKIRAQFDISLKRVEAVVGRLQEDWLTPDMARIMMEMRGIEEGFASARDTYPTEEDAETVTAAKGAAKLDKLADDENPSPKDEEEKKPEAKPKAAKKPAKKTAKKAAAKKEEPEPEPEPEQASEPEPPEEAAPDGEDKDEDTEFTAPEPEEAGEPPLFGDDS